MLTQGLLQDSVNAGSVMAPILSIHVFAAHSHAHILKFVR